MRLRLPKLTCKQKCKRSCKCLAFDPSKVCCKCWVKMSEKIKIMVTHKAWTLTIVVLIMLNSFTLATEYYEQPQWLTDTQQIANIVFTIIFALEMVFSMIGLGLK